MNPLSLRAVNFRSFEELTLDLPSGCLAILGSNGAGKSSLIAIIELCLYGTRSFAEYLRADCEDEMQIELTFSHRGTVYRIRRTYSPRGRGKTSVDFEKYEGDSYYPLTRETAAATQTAIEEVVGMSQAVFRISAFLAQGQSAGFTEAAPRDRKRLLADVLDLSVWDRLLEAARAEIIGIRDITTRLQIQVEEGERELEGKPETALKFGYENSNVEEAEKALAVAEVNHRDATEKLNASRELAAKLTAAREVLASRERELQAATNRHNQITLALKDADGLPKLRAESEALAGRRESIERDLLNAVEAETARNEHRRLTAEYQRLVAAANDLLQKEAALVAKFTALEGDPLGRCDRCEQILGLEVRERAITSMKTEALDYHAHAMQLRGEADDLIADIDLNAGLAASGPNAAKQAELENALALANEAERTLASIAEREKVVEELAVEFAALEVRRPQLEANVIGAKQAVAAFAADAPSEDLEAVVARAAGDLQEARADAEAAKSRLAVAQAELKRLESVEARVKENRTALAGHVAELERLALCEQAYGRNGIPVYVLENVALPYLENEVNAIVAELGTPYHVELRTQKERKSGDGLKEELYIEVDGREYRTYSGGERSRINLAFSRALARLLRSRGVEIDLLVMDEPDGLDAAGFAALAESLKGALADFEKVLVISHHPDLATAFDTTLTVEKENGRSRVVGAQVEAGVA